MALVPENYIKTMQIMDGIDAYILINKSIETVTLTIRLKLFIHCTFLTLFIL